MDRPEKFFEMSKTVFGRRHALAVAAVMADATGALDLEEICKRSGASRTAAFHELGVLAQTGAVLKLPSGPTTVTYESTRSDHPYWAYVRDLVAQVEGRRRAPV